MSAVRDVLAPGFKASPLWWDDAMPTPGQSPVPERADVAIIGSGYCGISAARVLARAGVRVVVLEAREPGFGGSSRNSGHVMGPTSLPANLRAAVGHERADAIYADCQIGNDEFRTLLQNEATDVDYEPNGRFLGAHSRAAYDTVLHKAEHYRRDLKMTIREVPKSEQRAEIGSDYYHGGIMIEDAGSLHPGKLYRRVRALAEAEGVTICGHARVEQIKRRGAGFVLMTARGTMAADKVVSATNGYAEPVVPYLWRRVVPVTPYLIATEPLPPDLANHILPSKCQGGDTKRLIYAFRRSPDGLRVIFTGRPRGNKVDERTAASLVHEMMCGVWPELRPYRISHCWKGFVAFTFDRMPHMGEHDGIHYAAGCQGGGVVLMTFLGRQMALKILGAQNRPCGFDTNQFPTVPFYRGNPWFLPPVETYYGLRDRLEQSAH